MNIPIQVKMSVSYQNAIPLKIATDTDSLSMSVTAPIESSRIPTYQGEYTVTPTTSTHVLETNGLKMTDNVTIEPIPSNYGLITWNGSFIKVS